MSGLGLLERAARSLLLSLLASAAAVLALVPWGALTSDAGQVVEPALVAAIVLAVTGTAQRAARVPGPVVALVQLAVAVVTLLALVTGSAPTPGAVDRLARELTLAVDAAALYPPPVPEADGGIGALLAVAAVSTVWLCECLAADLRAAPVVGLPLLAVLSLPVTILGTVVGADWSLAAALAYVALLAAHEADGRRRWGRPAPPARDGRAAYVPVAAPLVAVTALATAVAVPLVVPTLDLGLLDRIGRDGVSPESVVIGEPAANLQGDLQRGEDVPLLELRTRTTGVGTPSYLRVGVLPTFDDDAQAWVSGDLPERPLRDGLVATPGLRGDEPATAWEAEATDDLRSTWLPLLDDVVEVEADGGWLYRPEAGDLTREDATTAGSRWTFRVEPRTVTADQLRDTGGTDPSLPDVYTDVPDLEPDVVELTEEVTADADSDYERAVALQAFFRDTSQFTYDLGASAEGDDALSEFLLDTRTGFCQHFASAMAVMARELGIPSRVVVGFLQPRLVTVGAWEYSAHDLHAWPELYFPGSGWVRFEPTPSQRAASIPSYSVDTPDGSPTTPVPTAPPTSAPATGAPPTSAPPTSAPATPQGEDDDAAPGGRGDGLDLVPVLAVAGGLALVALLGVAVLAPALVRRRRRRGDGSAEAAWAELRASFVDHGLAWPGGRSPAATARALVDDWTDETDDVPDAALAALERVVTAVETERYADRSSAPVDVPVDASVDDAVATVVAARTAGLSRGRRLRARWWPASVLRPSRTGTGPTADTGEAALVGRPD